MSLTDPPEFVSSRLPKTSLDMPTPRFPYICRSLIEFCSLNGQAEVILAQEQGATMRRAGRAKELEAEFGAGVGQGTLVLTNKRLIFVCTDEKEDDLPVTLLPTGLQKIGIFYSEVEDIDRIPTDAPNVFIPLGFISSVGEHRGGLERPSLKVTWSDAQGEHTAVFVETLTGRRKRNLNDWAKVIQSLRAGTQKLVTLPEPPAPDTLEGRVYHVLADMQEKGIFAIGGSVEREYGVELNPDEIQAACDNLSSQHLLIRYPDSSGDVFYRRASPLGEDDSTG
jgi:hypothetical protein